MCVRMFVHTHAPTHTHIHTHRQKPSRLPNSKPAWPDKKQSSISLRLAASPSPFLHPNGRKTSFVTCQRAPLKVLFHAWKWVEQGIPQRKWFHKPRRWNWEKQSTCVCDVLCQHPVNSAQPIRTAAKWLAELSVSHSTDSASSTNIHNLICTHTNTHAVNMAGAHSSVRSDETCMCLRSHTHTLVRRYFQKVSKQNQNAERKYLRI